MAFAQGFAAVMTAQSGGAGLSDSEFVGVLGVIAAFCAEHFSEIDVQAVIGELLDPANNFASPAVEATVPGVVETLDQ